MCIDDFIGGDVSTGTTAELTHVEIVAEVTAEQPNENAAEMDPASADDAPLPTSAEVIAALALFRCFEELELTTKKDLAGDAEGASTAPTGQVGGRGGCTGSRHRRSAAMEEVQPMGRMVGPLGTGSSPPHMHHLNLSRRDDVTHTQTLEQAEIRVRG
ncbi:hypothetical protein HPB50_006742 [Hyalomma asiaticum]|uniref:Uncharacterized protein n=1 Tax=Hyalomma asiaticum TaxID=266040 RepID=A0ACB7TCZ3_HYAAI|nr:hypothetical protein HPB50_006742 [Hyalomma asiaticum]